MFTRDVRVPDNESFFGEVVEIPLGERRPISARQYCKCQLKPGGQSDIVCNYQYDVQNCEETEEKEDGVDKTDEYRLRPRRGKRAIEFTDKADDGYFSSKFIYDKDYVGQVNENIYLKNLCKAIWNSMLVNHHVDFFTNQYRLRSLYFI